MRPRGGDQGDLSQGEGEKSARETQDEGVAKQVSCQKGAGQKGAGEEVSGKEVSGEEVSGQAEEGVS